MTFYGLTAAGTQVNIEAANDTVFNDINAYSAPNVLSDIYGGSSANRAQTMVIVFSSPASGISFRYNPAGASGSATVFQAYSASGALLGSFSDPNATGDGVWYLETIPFANVGKVEIQAPSAGWGHYIDDLTFTPGSPGGTLVNFDLAGISAFTDVTTQYAAQGVTFYGLTAAGTQVNIEAANDTVFNDINAYSAPNVLSDIYGGSSANRAQTMVIVFSSPASGISFRYNPAGASGSATVFQAYSASGALLGSFSDPNATGDGVWYLETIPFANVGKVEIQAPSAGWGHYIDDLTFTPGSPGGTLVNFDLAGISAFTDVTTQYTAQGVTFYGLTAAGTQVNIEAANDTVFNDINAYSAPNVLSDIYGGSSANRAQTMVIVFSSPASGISFRYNPAGASGSATVFQAYSASGALLGQFFGPQCDGRRGLVSGDDSLRQRGQG